MKKYLSIVYFSISILSVKTQSIMDTINYPYWQEMMMDKSINFYKTKRAYELYFSNKPKIKGTGYKQFERWAENSKYFINPDGTFRPADYVLEEINKFKSNNLTPRGNNGGDWVNLGPFNNPAPASMQRGVGRVNEIAFHPTDPNTIYAGAPAGGFWFTTNKGQSWTKSNTDNIATFGVSAIAAIPSAGSDPILIIGTGDRDANDVPGLGTYISLDGGMNFTKSNTGMGNVVVNKLLVNPINKNNVIAATSSGIYKSYNQGQTWTISSSGLNFTDIKYSPDDSSILYACSSGSFFRSTNGGTTWLNITSGFSSNSKKRMAIAVTSANPNIVYVIAVNSNNGMEALYKSSNKGLNFSLVLSGSTYNPLSSSSNGSGTSGQGWYDLAIESSATDSNIVFVGGVNVFRSINGGKTFSCVAYWSYHPTIPWVHADIHFLGRNPLNNDLFIGSDGGVDYTYNNGSSYNNINTGLAIAQFYNLGVSQISKTKFITGAQDNGTSGGSSSSEWTAELGGDGMQCEVSNLDTVVMFGCSQYGNLQRTKNNGTTWGAITNSISETGPWVTPYHLHPRLDNIMLAVFQNVWISKNVVSANTPTFTRVSTGMAIDGTALRFSNVNDSFAFVGWTNGLIRYCSNIFAATPVFNPISNSNFGTGSVNDIETSYINKNILYVAKGNKIYKSSDLGVTWKDISGNLPNITIHSIVLNKYSSEGLYVGTQSGVYYKDSTMTNWIPFNNGLSMNAPVRDLEIVYDTFCTESSKIFAATYGRGLWVGSVFSDTSQSLLTLSSDKGNTICEGEKIVLTASGSTNYNYSQSSDFNKTSNNTFEITPARSGRYQISGKNVNGVCEVKSFDVIVNPKPRLSVNPTTKTIKKGDALAITATGASSYEWTPNKYFTGGNTSDKVNVKPDTTIVYTLKGISPEGCENTTKVTITVSGVNHIESNKDNFGVVIYPNPATSVLKILSEKFISIQIYDINGKVILSSRNLKLEHIMDVSKLSQGTYIVELEDKLGLKSQSKILIER